VATVDGLRATAPNSSTTSFIDSEDNHDSSSPMSSLLPAMARVFCSASLWTNGRSSTFIGSNWDRPLILL